MFEELSKPGIRVCWKHTLVFYKARSPKINIKNVPCRCFPLQFLPK